MWNFALPESWSFKKGSRRQAQSKITEFRARSNLQRTVFWMKLRSTGGIKLKRNPFSIFIEDLRILYMSDSIR